MKVNYKHRQGQRNLQTMLQYFEAENVQINSVTIIPDTQEEQKFAKGKHRRLRPR